MFVWNSSLLLRLCGVTLALAIGACAPKLVVQHDDILGPAVELRVSAGAPRTIEPGETRTMRVRPGMRHVELQVVEGDDPWGLPADGWELLVDGRVTLTLFRPDSPSASEARDEQR